MSTQINFGVYTPHLKSHGETFQKYMLDFEKFSKNYEKLIKGLSEEQKEFLVASFSRELYMHNGQHYTAMDFTPEEIVAQSQVDEAYMQNVKQENDYFRYGDYLLPKNNFYNWVFYYELGINNLKNKEKVKNKDIIDAGAAIGDSCLILNKLNPRKIYAFEPDMQNQSLIAQTAKLNNMEEIIVPISKGLGKRVETLEFTNNFQQKSFLELDTIDNFVEKNKLEVGLIKIHVEGSEMDVLRGAEKTIKKFKPVIISAIYHNAEQFFELKPLLESLKLGYKFRFEKYTPYSFISGLHIICEVY